MLHIGLISSEVISRLFDKRQWVLTVGLPECRRVEGTKIVDPFHRLDNIRD